MPIASSENRNDGLHLGSAHPTRYALGHQSTSHEFLSPAELGQRRAQRRTRDLQQPFERPTEFEDQKDRAGDR
jgi:hypothetical protein